MHRALSATSGARHRLALAFSLACAGLILPNSAVAADGPDSPPLDALTADIETGDADRFAALFARTGGKPAAEQLQQDYISLGSPGLAIFTPHRIVDGQNMATAILSDRERYAKAINTCLPVIKSTTAELRATYLAFQGLFPDRPLPRIYLVVGANNSGGTAGPGAQVLGLEVLCAIAKTDEDLREIMRTFYAHETVHVLQGATDAAGANILLASVLQEGAADFIARIVTGKQPDPARADWAMPREAELWQQFEHDLQTLHTVPWDELKRDTPQWSAFSRWIANAGNAPPGWPSETGYWIGQRIWERWYAQQPDKRAAIRQMLAPPDPEAILAAGRFRGARDVTGDAPGQPQP